MAIVFKAIVVLLIAAEGAVACSGSSDANGPAGVSGTGGASATTMGHDNVGGAGGSLATSSGSGGSKASSSSGGSSAAGDSSASGGSGGANATNGSSASGGSNGSDAGGSNATNDAGATPSFDDVAGWVDDYKATHPGQDGDINAKTPAQIAADPDARRLLSLCGEGQRPIIPALSWEYGGGDHAWINPEMSALVYCVYIPVAASSSNWTYDAGADHVTADVYVLFPDQNPCKDEQGADQVAKCIGDPTNFEILVDTASLNDGADARLSLSEASTELKLILPDDTKIHLYDGA